MSFLAAKRDELVRELAALPGPEARMEHLMERARQVAEQPELRKPENEVPGCTAQLWIGSSFRDGRCRFTADSESVVVKAITLLLCDFYSGATPEEILATDPSFLRGVGVVEHLSSNRRNALTKVWERINAYAVRCAQSPAG
jgi:cysteine desulfuration protein SufE